MCRKVCSVGPVFQRHLLQLFLLVNIKPETRSVPVSLIVCAGSVWSVSTWFPASPSSSSTSSSSPPSGERRDGGRNCWPAEWRLNRPDWWKGEWPGESQTKSHNQIMSDKTRRQLPWNQWLLQRGVDIYPTDFFSRGSRDNKRQREANNTTRMLIVVIAVFLSVEIPLMVITALHTISSTISSMISSSMDFMDYNLTNNIILVINLCIYLSYPLNFAIYCGMSRYFCKLAN